jgi:hypothetical protein
MICLVINWRLNTSNALETGHFEESISFCNFCSSIYISYYSLSIQFHLQDYINSNPRIPKQIENLLHFCLP